ncbi:MAG: aminopeptidase P family protein [Eubacteriales bacterium]|nr:aminopeptidase P family protein [Eubacteriales bacterium]
MINSKNRLDSLKKNLISKDISGILVSKQENQYYLSGFHSSNCHIIITAEENYLLTDFRYIESAKDLGFLYESVMIDHDYTLYTFLQELSLEKLAIEEEVMSYSSYKDLQESFYGELCSGDGLIEEIRITKDEKELSFIADAQALSDRCFEYLLEYIKPGLSELEVAFEIEMFLRKNGGERLSFDTICVSGNRTSLPHGGPTNKLLEKGDFITLDFGCVINGYCSDMTRTIALGSITQEQKDIYNIVLEAQQAGCNEIKARMSCFDADRVVRKIIEDAGFGKEFGHGTGHGVGLEIHEAPTLNPRSEEILKENMVVTIEPGIYLPGKFGVRIEDLVFVTDSSIKNATKSKKELIII